MPTQEIETSEHLVYSPKFKKSFPIADNAHKIDVHCPIDGTQLVSHIEYHNEYCYKYWYSYEACGARYILGDIIQIL